MLSIILICGMMLTSCSDKDELATSPEAPIAEDLADVTIIYYGCGGGNLDVMNIQDIREMGTITTKMILTTPLSRLARATGEAPSIPPSASWPSTR